VIITFEKERATGETTNPILNVEGKVLSWNLSGGTSPTEDVQAFGGKTFNFQKPREKFNVTFDLMINNSDFDFVQFGSGTSGAKIGTMTGRVVSSADTQYRWRVIFWFQSGASHVHKTNDATIVVPSKTVSCYRMIFCDVKAVSFDKSFSADEYFKGTLTLEFSATDSSGYANFFEDEGTGVGTAAGTTLASMTTSAGKGLKTKAKGYLGWVATAASAAWTAGTTANCYRH
jgi:hypothetical protein